VLCQDQPALLANLVDLHSYLPIWFQAIKVVSAEESGICSFPESLVRYLPLWCLASCLANGVSLCRFDTWLFYNKRRLNPSSDPGLWIGFQAMGGMGVGLGMQQDCVVVQNGLDQGDIPSVISIVMFFQPQGGSLLVSLMQNVPPTAFTST
jgi:hypothetical protein